MCYYFTLFNKWCLLYFREPHFPQPLLNRNLPLYLQPITVKANTQLANLNPINGSILLLCAIKAEQHQQFVWKLRRSSTYTSTDNVSHLPHNWTSICPIVCLPHKHMSYVYTLYKLPSTYYIITHYLHTWNNNYTRILFQVGYVYFEVHFFVTVEWSKLRKRCLAYDIHWQQNILVYYFMFVNTVLYLNWIWCLG